MTLKQKIWQHKKVLSLVHSGLSLIEARQQTYYYALTVKPTHKHGGFQNSLPDYNQKAFGVLDPKELEAWTK